MFDFTNILETSENLDFNKAPNFDPCDPISSVDFASEQSLLSNLEEQYKVNSDSGKKKT